MFLADGITGDECAVVACLNTFLAVAAAVVDCFELRLPIVSVQ